jgi:hyaluronan synthase
MDEICVQHPGAGIKAAAARRFFKINLSKIFYQVGVISFGLLILFLIVLFKSKVTVEFLTEPYLFSYSVFVTVFILSRIVSAMFYENSLISLFKEADVVGFWGQDLYEPSVTFVIPCKNEEKDIADTIRQCFLVDYPKNKMEIIVINDGSTDGTLQVLNGLVFEYPGLKIIDWVENQGKRKAMAAGFNAAQGELIIQLDSDSFLEPATFRELIAPFRHPRVGAVCASGEAKNADNNIFTRMQAAYYFMSFRILKAAESTYDTVFCCSGCCSAYRKRAVLPVLDAWLNEKFLGSPVTWGDDRALTSWLLKTGWKTVFNYRARAFTIVPDTLKKLLVQQLRWKKSWIVNFFFTIKFILKVQPFVAAFYYFPLVVISFLAPFMTFRALVWMPVFRGIFPFYHLAGIFLVTALIMLYYYFLDRKNRFFPYLFLWSFFNIFVLSFMLVFAALRIQDRTWGTR